MSLVPTYCKCSDGLWYKNPVWTNAVEGMRVWFICLDDDEPPELVVREGKPIPEIPWFQRKRHQHSSAYRMFSRSKFSPAVAYFGRIIDVPPPPQVFDWKGENRKPGECVFYDIEQERAQKAGAK